MTDFPRDDQSELIEEYLLGLVSADDAKAIEARASTDPAFAAEVVQLRETLAALGLSTPMVPDAALKARVIAAVGGSAGNKSAAPGAPKLDNTVPFPVADRSRSAVWMGFALAASLALVAKLSFDLRAARREASEATATVAVRDQALAHRDSMLATLTDPGMELVNLAATGAQKPLLRAYINHQNRRMTLSAASLDAMPAGRVYQLWFIVDGKPVPSVTFTPGADGHAMLENIPMPAGAVAATAVTAEPTGGSPAPTSAVLFVGKLADK